MEVPRRAQNLDEWLNMFSGDTFRSEAGLQAGLAFLPRPTDVLISPFAKSGTTWLQHIAHGLRTRGSMEFEEITDATPWIEMAYDYGWDLEADHIAEPRLFKSHLNWYEIPKGGRYICSFRHPYDALVSGYRFMEGWWFETGSISLEAFTRATRLKDPENGGYWHHLISWWEQHDNPDVLLLCYEDMKADLPTTVQTVAHFMGIPLDDELLEIVVHQSSREFMLAHRSHFDEHLIKEYLLHRGGPPLDGDAAKVTPGATDLERYILSPELKHDLDAVWHTMIYERFGFADYEALRAAVGTLSRS